jgi:6-phosphogluconolactonase
MSSVERLSPKGRVRFDIRRSAADLAEVAAEEAAQVLRTAIAVSGQASFVATGGSTPGPAYDRLSHADLDWSRVTITLSDERWVPADHPDSNERMVRERLLKGPAAAARFIGLKGDGATPRDDAALADAALADIGQPFDLVFLGMGDDGHIASLFPHSGALVPGLDPKAKARVIAVQAGQGRAPAQARLTLTAPALKAARRLVLMFTGQRKFDVLEAALRVSDPQLYPVQAILGAPAGVHVLCAS